MACITASTANTFISNTARTSSSDALPDFADIGLMYH